MNEPLLSVIIASYNAEPYIRKNIESLSQLKCSFEVIVVNDGSIDNTENILKELQSLYSWLIVVYQQNAGVSAARNRGINESKGKWLFFADADDWINADELDTLLANVENKNECVINFGCTFVYDDREERHHVQRTETTPKKLLNSGKFQLASWNYLFPARLIKNNGVDFPRGVICNEDQAFNIKAITTASKVLLLDYNVYNYNLTNQQSASHKKHGADWREGKLKAANDIISYCLNHQIDTSIIKNQIKRMFESYINDDTTLMNRTQTSHIYNKYYDIAGSRIAEWKDIKSLKIYRLNSIIGGFLFFVHKLMCR